jgi:hypothetical protein
VLLLILTGIPGKVGKLPPAYGKQGAEPLGALLYLR